jgi:hypothetical protein
LSNYFSVDNSTVEQGNVACLEGNLPWLSPNTLQILDNFTRDLNENPYPTDLMNIVPIRSNLIENEIVLMDSHSPIVEQSGGGGLANDIQGGRVIYKGERVMIYNSRHYQNFKKRIRY